jgi:glycosyltransferase involved in cell wall biosynthesis
VGEGSEKPGLMREAAQRRLTNLSFLDPLPKRELARLLAGSQAGLVCLAPVPEFAEWTAPNKLMDYLAAGLPVLSNVPGEAARLLAAGGCGETCAQPEAFAAALTRLAAEPTRREAMGLAARRLAERQHDRRLLAARFVAVVESALAPAGGIDLLAVVRIESAAACPVHVGSLDGPVLEPLAPAHPAGAGDSRDGPG